MNRLCSSIKHFLTNIGIDKIKGEITLFTKKKLGVYCRMRLYLNLVKNEYAIQSFGTAN